MSGRSARSDPARLGGGEPRLFPVFPVFAYCLLLLAVIVLSWAALSGRTAAFDDGVLLALRHADDLAKPIGPGWLKPAFLDVTALGGRPVLGLLVLAVSGFLYLQGRHQSALIFFAIAATGDVANTVLKLLFMRPRPDVVPHLREVGSSSFPSGHAMDSAIVFLTLAAMLAPVCVQATTRRFVWGFALFLAFIVGFSRMYLGVHYPTDVTAGWLFGVLWASAWWNVTRLKIYS